MLLEINMQFNIVIYSIIAGIITGILFDIYRIIRNLNSKKIVAMIEDILFWILAGMIVFTFLLYTNYAFFTTYVYIFIIISLLFYFKFLSCYFYNAEKQVVNVIYRIIRVLVKDLLYPLKFILYKITDRNK
ncbi:MAG: spore cortex biosynthesis protein YabQ [Clostridium butyricum]|nr:spore cortex biosynthesis protein YabQ [Clostridium butyricum]